MFSCLIFMITCPISMPDICRKLCRKLIYNYVIKMFKSCAKNSLKKNSRKKYSKNDEF